MATTRCPHNQHSSPNDSTQRIQTNSNPPDQPLPDTYYRNILMRILSKLANTQDETCDVESTYHDRHQFDFLNSLFQAVCDESSQQEPSPHQSNRFSPYNHRPTIATPPARIKIGDNSYTVRSPHSWCTRTAVNEQGNRSFSYSDG